MPDQTFDLFLARREAAASAYVRGDGAPLEAMLPRSGPASFHSPTGDTVTSAGEVTKRYLSDAALFGEDGISRFDIIQSGASGDLGYWTGFQVATVTLGNPPKQVDMRIRVTEIFRRIDGDWKLVHRHADSPAEG